MRLGCLLSNGSAHFGSPSDLHTQHLIEWPGKVKLEMPYFLCQDEWIPESIAKAKTRATPR